MEGYIHIVLKKNVNIPSNEILTSVINTSKSANHYFNFKRNKQLVSIYFTNEYNNYPYHNSEGYLFAPTGQFTIDKKNIQNTLQNDWANAYAMVSNLRGSFSISLSNLNTSTVDVFTHVIRAEGVFLYEDNEKYIIGSDPLLISMLSNSSLKPEFDEANFVSFLEHGYYADELTPYKNIKAVSPNKHIRINNEITIRDIDNTYQKKFTSSPNEEYFEEVKDDFLKSLDIAPKEIQKMRIGITGGRDSRLLLFALLEKGYNVKTFTRGFLDHPDVIMGKKIAGLYNLEHEINEPKINDKNQLGINLESRIDTLTRASSGLLSAYDTVNSSTTFKGEHNFNGAGAASIRGGFIAFRKQNVDKTLSFKNLFYKMSEFYNDDNNKYNQFLNNISKQYDTLDELLYMYFLFYRTGRWTSDSRIAKSYAGNSNSIYLDNQLTKKTLELNLNDIYSEIIYYKLIEKLRPDAVDLPFETKRYYFEKEGPVSPGDYQNWLNREPLYATTKLGKYNWRSLGNNDPQLINAIKNIVLSNKSNRVFNTVNYNKVEELLNKKLTNRHNKFIWSLVTLIHLNNIYSNMETFQGKMRLKIDVPADSIKKIQVPSKIIDLTNNLMKNNNSISFNNNIITSNNTEGNRYIKTYEGNFNDVPNSVEIDNVKKVTINTHLTNLAESYSEAELIKNATLICYNNEKRFRNIPIEITYKNNHIIIKSTFEIPLKAIYFRLAILLNKEEDLNIKVNYSYIDLKFS